MINLYDYNYYISMSLLRDVDIAAIMYKYCTCPVSDMLSFHNCYARRPLNKRKLDCNHNFAITVM